MSGHKVSKLNFMISIIPFTCSRGRNRTVPTLSCIISRKNLWSQFTSFMYRTSFYVFILLALAFISYSSCFCLWFWSPLILALIMMDGRGWSRWPQKMQHSLSSSTQACSSVQKELSSIFTNKRCIETSSVLHFVALWSCKP